MLTVVNTGVTADDSNVISFAAIQQRMISHEKGRCWLTEFSGFQAQETVTKHLRYKEENCICSFQYFKDKKGNFLKIVKTGVEEWTL